MRKFFILVLLMTLQMMARGQTAATFESLGLPHPTTAKSMRYWIDDDAESVKAINDINGKYTIDMSALIEGLHTIHYQIIDNEGKVAVPYSGIFLTLPKGDYTQANKLRYWFDDATDVRTCNTNAGIQTLDASSLLDGVHTLHYQVVDTEGQASYVASDIFLKIKGVGTDENISASKLVYWFDDQETTTIEMTSGIQVLDASNLLNGLHTIHYMVVCSDGSITSAYSSIFMRMDIDAETTAAKSLRYWFDDENDATEVEMTAEVQTLDVSHLLDGLHTVHYQLIDNKGMSAIPMSSIFMKMTGGTSESSAAQSLRYWFDDDTDVRVTSVAGGTQSLDVTELHTGLHTLHYQLIDDKGNVCAPMSGIFMKMFDKNVASEENVITQYMYWMNDESKSNNKVVINKPTSPYQLITLLPMIKAPIRSNSFHFEVNNGEPMVYAKNDLHIRFEDAAGYWADASKSFIDYSVSEKVEVTKQLTEVFGDETLPSPKNGEIKWYAMECEQGDSIAVQSSQATSIQIFAPSGEEVYSASGSESVAMGGVHAREDGVFYLAIHDVTGSGTNLTLDYIHLDKYYIMSYSPTAQGNTNTSIEMDLVGNGLDKLYDVKMSNGSISLELDTIVNKSNSRATAFITMENAVNGKYDIVFYFIDNGKKDSIILNEAFTIEEPQFADIEVSVDHKYSSFNPVTLEITVTNPGNTKYTLVPFNIAFDKIENISKIDFKNFWISKPKEADSLGYTNIVATNNLLGKQVKGGMMFLFIPSLKPKETKKFLLDISFIIPGVSSAFYAWTSMPLERDTIYQNKYQHRVKKEFNAELANNILTPGDYWNVGSRIADIFNLHLPAPADLAINIADNAVTTGVAFAGISEALDHQVDMAVMDAYGIDPDSELGQEISNLHGQGLIAPIDLFGGPIEEFISGLLGCHRQCAQQPDPNPTGVGAAAHYIAVDPNDIFGYRSDSGSKFIKNSIKDVFYRIEFENDTTFASASAHLIEIKDTLDRKYFDLSTYAPASVKIGNRIEYLDGKPNFIKTIDMRPEIYAIAQVEGKYDQTKGIATWTFTSLDPMTMEPTDDIMQGILPINYDGVSGIGEATYDISLKQGLSDGVEIPNRASIVFDINAPILTPTWTNIIDAIAPTSCVTNVVEQNDSVVSIYFNGDDERSGIWKYDLYVQNGHSSWVKIAECGADSSHIDYKVSNGLDYGFCVLATDSAGNVEKKELMREGEFVKVNLGDVNCDGEVNTLDASLTIGYYLEQPVSILAIAADINDDGVINTLDATQITQIYLNANTASRAKAKMARQRLKTTK